MFDDRSFEAVRLEKRSRNLCSPDRPAPGWRGIAIRAPAKVTYDGPRGGELRHPIPICGYYLLPVEEPGPKVMRLVARDRLTGRVYRGVVGAPSDAAPPPTRPPLDPSLRSRLASGGYFNPNLTEWVALPKQPAIYEVAVEHKGQRSNAVVIEISEEPPPTNVGDR